MMITYQYGNSFNVLNTLDSVFTYPVGFFAIIPVPGSVYASLVLQDYTGGLVNQDYTGELVGNDYTGSFTNLTN